MMGLWIMTNILHLSDILKHREIQCRLLSSQGCPWNNASAPSWNSQFPRRSCSKNDRSLTPCCWNQVPNPSDQRMDTGEDIHCQEGIVLVQIDSYCSGNSAPASLSAKENPASWETSCWGTCRWRWRSGSLGGCKRRGSSFLKTSQQTSDQSGKTKKWFFTPDFFVTCSIWYRTHWSVDPVASDVELRWCIPGQLKCIS